jgi:hypothetical protein
MGGGDNPPMDVLKNWMYEQVSVNPSHEPVQLQLDANMTPDPNQLNNVLGLVSLPFSAHQESAQSYDWNNAQYVADQECYELMDNTGAVVDESLILTSQHHPQAFATSF